MTQPQRAFSTGRGESLRHQIYEELREKLRNGDVGPDDRLVDTAIAKSLGVSRMPVREALLQLVSEGHLVSTTRGFALPELDLDDIADIFEVRRLLEPRAAANAARDLDDGAKATLRRLVSDAREAVASGDPAALAEANKHFRATWLGALRNHRLAETISRFADQVLVVRQTTLQDPETRQVVLDGMSAICEAFLMGDAPAVQDRMQAFMIDAERSYVRLHAAGLSRDGLSPADKEDDDA